jgi:hypothetical protein
MTKRFVYVIGPSVVKIGTTDDLSARLAALQTCSPVKLAVLWSTVADDGAQMEGQLHRAFADRRLHGEWFDLGRDAIHQVEAAMAGPGTPRRISGARNAYGTKPWRPALQPSVPGSEAHALACAILSIWPGNADRLGSAKVVDGLSELTGWRDTWPSRGVALLEIAAVLRPYGCGPTKIRLGPRTVNGYLKKRMEIVAGLREPTGALTP